MRLLLRLAIVGAVIPVALEASARLEDWIRFGVPVTSNISGVGDLGVLDSQGVHSRPNAAYRQFKIDSRGFRGPEVSDQQLTKGTVIVATGSSETFGLYESPDREWPRVLEQRFRDDCGSSELTVLNAATAGMSLPWVSVDLKHRLGKLMPQVLIYYLQPTQYLWDSVPSVREYAKRSASPVNGFHSRVAFRIRTEIKEALPGWILDGLRRRDLAASRSGGVVPFSRFPHERLDSLDSHLRQLVGELRQRNLPLLLVIPYNRFTDTTTTAERRWLRAWEKQVPKADGALLLQFSDSAVARMRSIARDSGAAIVDPSFPESPERAHYFADPVHFTDLGATLVADSVKQHLRPLLDCSMIHDPTH